MTAVILILILIILILLLCAASFVSGYILAGKTRKEPQSKELTEQEKKELERKSREALLRQKELANFWSYNGDEQEQIHLD